MLTAKPHALYLFNPEHDYALANNSEHFVPLANIISYNTPLISYNGGLPCGKRKGKWTIFAAYINNIYYEETYTDLQSGKKDVGDVLNPDFYEYRVGCYSGLINSKGEIITPPIYTNITGISPTLFKAQLQDWNSIVIIDQKGKVISKVS
ncbi:MAG: hypothetical protein J6T13_08635 [Bacteroidales bacterium]|nr:hypothetical protein [Bacteroidales bacterium]